jgi:hypothetical protein
MFSTTPITRWFIIEAMVPARSATSDAAGLRRGDHQHLGVRELLAQRDGHVTGAGRQVQQQKVQVAPVHVGQHLGEGPVQDGSPPGDDLSRRGLSIPIEMTFSGPAGTGMIMSSTEVGR